MAAVEPLEQRRLLSSVSTSQSLADQLVNNISSANNNYSYGSPVVTWKGINGATSYSNFSDCSSFETKLLETAYGFNASQMTAWTGYSSPQAADYYEAAVKDKGFTGFTQIADLQVGDAVFFDYANDPDSSNDSGHVVTIDALPALISTSSTERAYNITVVDCTANPHSDDTRTGTESGVGRGVMRFYTDLSGNLISYSWGTSPDSEIYTESERASIFAKLPPMNGTTWLSAGSAATWNASNNTLVVNGPTSITADPTSTYQPAVIANTSSAQLLVIDGTTTATVHLASLNLSGGATATVYDPNSGQLLLDVGANLTTGIVSIDSTSTLDLGSNDMIVHAGNLPAIDALLTRGYASGTWQGTGITSSAVTSDSTHLTALGAILDTSGTSTLYSTFDGVSANSTCVLVRRTYYGDTNLDGQIDGSDYTRIDNGYINHLTGWYNGDLNYDGAVNGSDYTLMDNAYNNQASQIVFTPSSEIADPATKLTKATPAMSAEASSSSPADDARRKRRWATAHVIDLIDALERLPI